MVGCRKDPHFEINPPLVAEPPCNEPGCEIFPEDQGFGFNYIVEDMQYFKPSFNPNNQDEFVFIRLNPGVSPPQLVQYNFSTGEQTVLHDYIVGRPKWGRQGWITFAGTDNIFIIKDDGSSLSQITWGEDDTYPVFNYEGDKIYYNRNKNYTNAMLEANPELYKEDKEILIDLEGNVIDSIMIPNISNSNTTYFSYLRWGISDITSNNLVYAMLGNGADTFGIYLIDPDIGTIQPIHTWIVGSNGNTLPTDMVYSNGYIYFSRWRNGLYKVDVNSGITTTIIEGCSTQYYENLTISPDGHFLIAEKVTYKPLNNYDIVENHEIWKISLDSCYQERILGN